MADPVDMAVTRAERRALKRAFDVAGMPEPPAGDYEADWHDHTPVAYAPVRELPPLPGGDENGGGGERTGGQAAAPTETSATPRTQPEASATTGTTPPDDQPQVSGPGDAGDTQSPASLDGSTVMAMFAHLNATQRGIVRGEWAKRAITADEQPDECARVIREVSGE